MHLAVSPNLLTAVVPISRMAGRLELLKRWLSDCGGKPISVVLVHDENDLETQGELESLVSKLNNPNIHLFRGEFNGPGMARNYGMKYIASEWVAFWDSDDFPEVDAVLNELSRSIPKVDVIIGTFSAYTKSEFMNLNKRTFVENEVPSYVSLFLNPGMWRWIFRAKDIENLTFLSYRLAEDQSFLLDYLYSHPKIFRTQTRFYNYIVGQDTSLTSGTEYSKELKKVANRNLKKAIHEYDRVSVLAIAVSVKIYWTYLKRVYVRNSKMKLPHDS